MKEIIMTGNTVEEAVELACRQLDVEKENVDFEILEEAQPKVFGLFGGTPAKVKVTVKVSPTEVAKEYLASILELLGVRDLDITEETTEERTILNINGNDEDLGVIIGRRGETLTALQYIVSLSANNACDDYFKVSLNVKNFREKREKTLETVASKTAYKASKLNKNIALEPMSPYERSIIHTTVQDIEGVTSWSVGENEKRHVVIGPEGLDEGGEGIPVKYAKLNNNRSSYGRGGRGGYNRSSYNRDGGRSGYGRTGRGGYNRSSYSRDNSSDGEGGRENRSGYNRNGYRKNYNRGGYNRYNNDNNNNNRSNHNNSAAKTERTNLNSGLAYGRIEINNNNNTEE